MHNNVAWTALLRPRRADNDFYFRGASDREGDEETPGDAWYFSVILRAAQIKLSTAKLFIQKWLKIYCILISWFNVHN